jgi:xanthine dehydrogenase YagS FAD-binding subunit
MIVSGGNIQRCRLAAGAVQCVPRRLSVVEDVVTGQPKSEATATLAGQSAIRNATPLNFNHFKIPLLRNLVMRAVRDS